ncbi:CD59-like protein [Schistosoma japonicum]|uniref:CD59-like protein n=1 Tax=Schistosoma japonicum TaxID=6182 RepID=A0A4Z2CQ78_SCHJA|nr:CD59-like protein [Schistosoma japonicum]TNN06421.1 CD59-like protein [Schistosoma japonicum]
MKFFINFLSSFLIIITMKELNSIKCYECKNCPTITNDVPIVSQCRRCLVNRTQTGIIRSCVQTCPLVTPKEYHRRSIKCCRKDLCNFANFPVTNKNIYITSTLIIMAIMSLIEKL